MSKIPKIIKLGSNKVRIIDKNFDFICSESWLHHLDTLSAQDLIDVINDLKSILANTKPTVDRDLVYEKHQLTTFSWKLTYKQQLSLF